MRRVLAALGLVIGLATSAAAQKRIYIAPDDHTDYMWSANEAFYQDYFVRGLDAYLDQIDATAGLPSERQARWNADGTLWLQAYEAAKPGAPFDRLMARVKDGHIGVPLNGLVEVHGGSPLEVVLRDMYYAGRLERRYNHRFDLAVAMENQTLAYGLGSLMASAGAKYSWKGVCACATQTGASGNRQYDAYWWVGPDGSRILMKWNSLQPPLPGTVDGNGNQGPGGYAEARVPREAIAFVDTSTAFRARFPYDSIGLFGAGWDDADYIIPLNDSRSFPRVAAELTTSGRQVIVSNISDFFRDFEARYGSRLPSQSVSFGNEWEVSTAAYAAKAARVKQAVEQLRSAEAMATIVSLSQPGFMTPRVAARDAAYQAMGLFFEHNVNGGGPCCSTDDRVAFEERQVQRIEAYVQPLHADARAALAGLIPAGGPYPRVFAFNPLGWVRSDVAEIAWPGNDPVYVVDPALARQVPHETIGSGADRRLRFTALNIPSLGYKLFEVRPGLGSLRTPPPVFSDGVLSTSRYQLRLSGSGAITSLIRRLPTPLELVRPSNGLALNDFGSGTGTVTLEHVGPVSATVRADVGGPLPRTVRVTLYTGIDRIDIDNRINAGFDDLHSYSFAFGIDNPLVRHEEVGAVITARLAPEGQYSPRGQASGTWNALYQWLSLNHFADMTTGDNSFGITLSNADAQFMRLGNSTFGQLDTTTPRIDVLAGGRANGDGIALAQNQGGDTAFRNRFALRPHGAYNQLNAMKLAMEHQNPLVTGIAAGGGGAPLPAPTWSFLSVANAAQLVWAVKPAEDGIDAGANGGIIVRLWNQTRGVADFVPTIGAPYRTTGIRATSSIETDLAVQSLRVRSNQVATFRLLLP